MMTKQQMLKIANKCMIVNATVAKTIKNKTMIRRLISNKILNEYDLDNCIENDIIHCELGAASLVKKIEEL